MASGTDVIQTISFPMMCLLILARRCMSYRCAGQPLLNCVVNCFSNKLLTSDKLFWRCAPTSCAHHCTTCLQVGEFVEVSNNSKTDPCAWLGCVASVGKKYLVRTRSYSGCYNVECQAVCTTLDVACWLAYCCCTINCASGHVE